MTDAPPSSDMIRKTIEEKIALVDEAMAALKNNEIAVLDTLEHDIERLCETIGHQPLETALTLEDDMARLIAKLDMLASALQDFQDEANAAADKQENE